MFGNDCNKLDSVVKVITISQVFKREIQMECDKKINKSKLLHENHDRNSLVTIIPQSFTCSISLIF